MISTFIITSLKLRAILACFPNPHPLALPPAPFEWTECDTNRNVFSRPRLIYYQSGRVFRLIRTVSGLARPIPTFSTVAAADRKYGLWCVLGWKPTGWTSGSRHTPRKQVWNIKNHGDGEQLLPVCCRHGGKRSGWTCLASDRPSLSSEHVADSCMSRNPVW